MRCSAETCPAHAAVAAPPRRPHISLTPRLPAQVKNLQRLRTSKSNKVGAQPACMWTAEAADEQMVRKSGDEVFAAATSLAALSAGARRMAKGASGSFSRTRRGKSGGGSSSGISGNLESVRDERESVRGNDFESRRDASGAGGS